MVLTQRRDGALCLSLEHVSIPLWFSRNADTGTASTTATRCFHTTMVLTQRAWDKASGSLGFSFPYHYGSHATLGIAQWQFEGSLFPYHYGSHATQPARFSFFLGILTFPYHYGSHATHEPRKNA